MRPVQHATHEARGTASKVPLNILEVGTKWLLPCHNVFPSFSFIPIHSPYCSSLHSRLSSLL